MSHLAKRPTQHLILTITLLTVFWAALTHTWHALQGPLAGPLGLPPVTIEQAYVTQAKAVAAARGKVDKAVGDDSPLALSVLSDAAVAGATQPESATSSVPFEVNHCSKFSARHSARSTLL